MRVEQIHKIVLMSVLLIPVAGCGRVQQAATAGSLNEAKAATSDTQPDQSAQPLKPHVVRGRFEPGSTDGELTFIFEVSPKPEALPNVRWVAAAGDDARTLVVQSDETGRYSAVLAGVPKVSDGQVLIELSNPDNKLAEVHGAEFALREQVADRPAARPSRDGHFQVFTKPEGVSPELRLLIGSSEQPIENLPKGVTTGAVAGVYTLDFLPAANPDGWLLTIAAPTGAHSVLFYIAKDGAGWRVLNTKMIESHKLLSADFAGAGTYMLVREVTR